MKGSDGRGRGKMINGETNISESVTNRKRWRHCSTGSDEATLTDTASLWREDISKYRLVRSSLQTWDLYVCRLFRILSCVACGADQLKRVVQWKKSGNRQEFFRVTTRTMDKWLLMRCLTDGTDEDTSSGIQSDAESEWLTYTLNVDTKEWVK